MTRSQHWTASFLAVIASNIATAPLVSGQHSGWVDGQISATMCMWQQPRAAVVKDTVYIDGGYLWWSAGMESGEFSHPTQDGNPLGLVYTLNFSKPFISEGNVSALFEVMSKAPNGGAAHNLAPNYFDGAMLANNHEWFLYGGVLTETAAHDSPREDEVLGYQLSSYGVEKPGFRSGFLEKRLPDGMSRYISYGGAVNVPSENKAWYFGGMVGDDGQEIFYPSGDEDLAATNHSDTLMMLDMATQYDEIWKNMTLPDDIKGRANPEVVWVPVGEQGILVVLGGVLYPEFAQANHVSANEAASRDTGNDFMSIIDIYDIANDRWYKQPTVGGPTARTRGCAVVAPARDYSSQNIYWYGGYDGLDATAEFDDDIWILSLPSFMWMKVSSASNGNHGRAGHKCVMPYPDQMIVIGGYSNLAGDSIKCLEGGVVEVVNLTNGKWMDDYHPDEHHDYGVPEMIHLMIGGDWAGGATMRTPIPTGWSNPDLASVFSIAYPTDKIETYYPYPVDEEFENIGKGGGWPTWATVLIVVLLLVLAAVAGLVLYLLRRRKQIAKHEGTEGASEESGNRIISWIKGQSNEKAGTVTTEETAISPIPRSLQPLPPPPPQDLSMHYEMPDSSVPMEMMDTSPHPPPCVELGDTGLNHNAVIDKHTHFGQNGQGSLNNPPYYSNSGISQLDHASSTTGHSNSGISPVGVLDSNNSSIAPPRPQPSQAPVTNRPDSPSLGLPPPDRPSTPPQQRMASALSGLTSPTGHMRDDSVSTLGDIPLDRSGTPLQAPGQAPFNTPVSPPQPGEEFGAMESVSPPLPQGSPSPLRRSVFYENEDDMGGRRI